MDDKWLPYLRAGVQSELDRVSQNLTGRISQLGERYQTPLSKLVKNVDVFAAKVEAHLQQMEATWD